MNIQDMQEEDPNGAFKQPRPLKRNVVIPLKKTVTYEIPNGELHIQLQDDTYYVWYHNPHLVGNPFRCSVFFSTAFTIEDIVNSYEVRLFISRFE